VQTPFAPGGFYTGKIKHGGTRAQRPRRLLLSSQKSVNCLMLTTNYPPALCNWVLSHRRTFRCHEGRNLREEDSGKARREAVSAARTRGRHEPAVSGDAGVVRLAPCRGETSMSAHLTLPAHPVVLPKGLKFTRKAESFLCNGKNDKSCTEHLLFEDLRGKMDTQPFPSSGRCSWRTRPKTSLCKERGKKTLRSKNGDVGYNPAQQQAES